MVDVKEVRVLLKLCESLVASRGVKLLVQKAEFCALRTHSQEGASKRVRRVVRLTSDSSADSRDGHIESGSVVSHYLKFQSHAVLKSTQLMLPSSSFGVSLATDGGSVGNAVCTCTAVFVGHGGVEHLLSAFGFLCWLDPLIISDLRFVTH
jgi:hypothetical protein